MRSFKNSDLTFQVKKGEFDAKPFGGYISPTNLYGARDFKLELVDRNLICSVDYSGALTKPNGDCRTDARNFEKYIHQMEQFEIFDEYTLKRFIKALKRRLNAFDAIILVIKLKSVHQFKCKISTRKTGSLVFLIVQ